MRETFLDPALQAAFARDGFVVRDLLDHERLSALRAAVDDVYPGPNEGMHTTIQSPCARYRASVIERVPPFVTDLLDDLLSEHDLITASLAIKWPGPDTGFCTHQDWTMVDERRFRSVNVWIPLVDVDEATGALGVLPGSHRVLDHLRCSPMNPVGFVSEGTAISYEELDTVELAAGQALFFDNGLLHGSGPNLTQTPRHAIIVAMKPAEARILHYFLPDGGSWIADRYEVDTSFFEDYVIGQQPRFEVAGRDDFYGTPRRRDEILLACGREPAPDHGATLVPPPEIDASLTASGLKGRPSHDGRFPTLVDRDLDEQLSIEGYVVLDLLDDTTLAELRAITEELYVDDRAGFHASNLSSSHQYRREVARLAAPVIERAALDLFVDHEAYTASLLMKWPDEDSAFHPHQDWTMVDEARYRTVNVWCPLVDATIENGTLRVVPGSHRLLDSFRCSPMPPSGYQNPGWQVGWQQMVPVELRVGQVLVFDHALLHSSGPNTTGEVRAAVAAAFKPREAALYHWYLGDPSSTRLDRYRIDANFFADIVIGERPDYELDGEDEFTWRELSVDTLLTECGLVPQTRHSEPTEVGVEPRRDDGSPEHQPLPDELQAVGVEPVAVSVRSRLRRSAVRALRGSARRVRAGLTR